MIRRMFSPPVFEQEEKNLRAKFIHGFAWMVIGLLLLAMMPHLFGNAKNLTIGVLSGLIVVMLSALYLLHRGNVAISGLLIIVLGWLGVSIQALTADGVKDAVIVAFLALGLFASIVISWRIGIVIILSGIAVTWILALLQVGNYFVPSSQDPIAFARDLSLVFIAVAVLVYLGTKSMHDVIQRAVTSVNELMRSNENLKERNQTLEEQVEARTAELTAANARNERRARQFEAIAQVAKAITSLKEENTLLSRLAQLISEYFGFYHVGIYLLDEKLQYAVLRASNSEGGRKLLARRHQLRIGQAGIVGHVAASGAPRIALGVEADPAFKDNPELPETRSELALPLKVGEQILGVLDVQSTAANAFQPGDTEVLYLLADQVALAIQNTRSYESTQRLLEETQRASASYLKGAWRLLQTGENQIGYRVADNTVKPLTNFVSAPHVHKAISQGEVVVEGGDRATLAVPIHLRGDVVGALDVHVPAGHEWDPDEIDIAKAVADRLSLALESATLLQSTQRRAEIERLTADISGKISASINLRSVLETAVEELGHVLPGSEIVIQFSNDK